jgi:sulfatase maturation enzyme AslB (radical SAM superfamily)
VDQPTLSPERWKYVHLSSSTMLGCDVCSARMLCGGGCRAVVLDAGGDLETGTAPGYCTTTRAHARAVTTIYDTLMAENNPLLRQLLDSAASATTALTALAIE